MVEAPSYVDGGHREEVEQGSLVTVVAREAPSWVLAGEAVLRLQFSLFLFNLDAFRLTHDYRSKERVLKKDIAAAVVFVKRKS